MNGVKIIRHEAICAPEVRQTLKSNLKISRVISLKSVYILTIVLRPSKKEAVIGTILLWMPRAE